MLPPRTSVCVRLVDTAVRDDQVEEGAKVQKANLPDKPIRSPYFELLLMELCSVEQSSQMAWGYRLAAHSCVPVFQIAGFPDCWFFRLPVFQIAAEPLNLFFLQLDLSVSLDYDGSRNQVE